MQFGATSLCKAKQWFDYVASFGVMFFADDGSGIIDIFFFRTVLFVVMKSCGAVFRRKSLVFGVQGSNEIGSKDLRFSVQYGVQMPAAARSHHGEPREQSETVLSSSISNSHCPVQSWARSVRANWCRSSDIGVIITLLKVKNSLREQDY